MLSPLRPFRDAYTIRRLRRGERDAFESVVKTHYSGIYRQLWHLSGGDDETAADMTQETFIAAWRALPGFAGRSSLRTWLYTIALRVWRAHLSKGAEKFSRSAVAFPGEGAEDAIHEIADSAPTPDKVFQTRNTASAVQDAIAALPETLRETAVLYYVQGLRYREIADILEIPIGTVKSRLNAALKKLETLLAEHAPCAADAGLKD